MPRAFPYPITIGTDICQISRIYHILTKGDSRYTKLFQKRILTPREQTAHADRLKALRIYIHKLSQIEGVSKPPPTGISNEIIRAAQGLRAMGKDQLLEEMGGSLDDVAVFLAGR
jgi:phosphopantetheinyl transferase (holo-ACP synthase)